MVIIINLHMHNMYSFKTSIHTKNYLYEVRQAYPRKRPQTIKFFFDGKSYKLSHKPLVWNFRFNKANMNIFYTRNISFWTKEHQKKGYFTPLFKLSTSRYLQHVLRKIRPSNTFTIRGVHSSAEFFYKRTGRVSEYI